LVNTDMKTSNLKFLRKIKSSSRRKRLKISDNFPVKVISGKMW
jgi:hypothetical protein